MYQKQLQKRRAGRVGGGCSRSGARRTEGLVASLLKVARFRYNEFRERFGREPGPDEPLLFDPRQDSPSKADPAEMRLQVIAATTATRGDPIVVLKFLGLA